jgi:hypothetical protein
MMNKPLFLNDIGTGRCLYELNRIPKEDDYVDFVASYEDMSPALIPKMVNNNWVFKLHSPDYQTIVITRDMKNWAASLYTFLKQYNPKPDIRQAIKLREEYEHCAGFKIDYSKWVDDEDYRKEIAASLNLKYNDSTLNQNTAMGSSFGKGLVPGFNSRWDMVKDEHFRAQVGNLPV